MSSYYNHETHNVEYDDDDFDDVCYHVCDPDEGCDGHCDHEHCFNCGECQCPGYCDDHQTYNLRPPAETGGPS